MSELLFSATRLGMLLFLLASMLELGLSLTFTQLLGALNNARVLALALLANFVIGPLLAFVIAKVLSLEQPFVIGLLLLGLSPGAPFIPKLVQLAKGDVPFAVALMTVLMIGTVFDLPLVLPRIITRVQVNAWQVEKTLLLLVLLPLLAGLVAHAKLPSLPGWLPRALGRLSNLSGLLVIVLIVSLNFNSVLSLFGTGAVFGGFLFAALCLITGWLLGFPLPDPATRRALGLATGSRNVAAALIVGAQNFKDPKVNVMVITTAVIGLILLIPAAIVLRRRVRAQFRPTPSVSSGHHTF